ncbi:hypothetical protein [Xanthomonas sacchari]|uniref:hypothetical protein n=1 Tax=Xanthomonas sacchari TaxID=56458 RepID=UPI003528C3E3
MYEAVAAACLANIVHFDVAATMDRCMPDVSSATTALAGLEVRGQVGRDCSPGSPQLAKTPVADALLHFVR